MLCTWLRGIFCNSLLKWFSSVGGFIISTGYNSNHSFVDLNPFAPLNIQWVTGVEDKVALDRSFYSKFLEHKSGDPSNELKYFSLLAYSQWTASGNFRKIHLIDLQICAPKNRKQNALLWNGTLLRFHHKNFFISLISLKINCNQDRLQS